MSDNGHESSDSTEWWAELLQPPSTPRRARPPEPSADDDSDEWWHGMVGGAPATGASPSVAQATGASPSVAPSVADSFSQRTGINLALRVRMSRLMPLRSLIDIRRHLPAQGVSRSMEIVSVDGLASAYPASPLEMPTHGQIITSFLNAGPASEEQALADCLGRLSRWFSTFCGVAIFKVGITCDPSHRWHNPAYGYMQERVWHAMDVVFVGTVEQCRQLETSVISTVGRIPGCQNVAPGGEGLAAASSERCFTYLVVAAGGTGVGLQAAFALRERERNVRPRRDWKNRAAR